MRAPHANTGAVGILGLQAGEDVNTAEVGRAVKRHPNKVREALHHASLIDAEGPELFRIPHPLPGAGIEAGDK